MNGDANRRWLIVLVASLVLNGLLLGFVLGGGVGRSIHGDTSRPHLHGAGTSMMHAIGDVSTAADRAEIRSAFRHAFAETRDQRRDQRQARRALSEAISADPYDEAAVRSAFEALRAAELALETRMHETLAEQLGALSPEQRQAIVQSMRDRRGMHRPGPGPEVPR